MDDDETLRTELGALLRDSGHGVSLAAGGAEALECLGKDEVDVVLLDWVMPGMSGLEVLREGHAAHPTTTFIVMTGHGTVDAAVEAMKAGASEFVRKPFDFDDLEGMLRAMDEKLHVRKELARLLETQSGSPASSPTSDVIAVLLTYMDGTLIGSRNRSGETVLDQDLLAATLSLIQDFMRTSFPLLRGEMLRTIVQGRYRLLIDSGEWVYLTVIIEGAETPELRARMRQLRDGFERQNREVLVHWNGIAKQVGGLDDVLAAFFPEPP